MIADPIVSGDRRHGARVGLYPGPPMHSSGVAHRLRCAGRLRHDQDCRHRGRGRKLRCPLVTMIRVSGSWRWFSIPAGLPASCSPHRLTTPLADREFPKTFFGRSGSVVRQNRRGSARRHHRFARCPDDVRRLPPRTVPGPQRSRTAGGSGGPHAGQGDPFPVTGLARSSIAWSRTLQPASRSAGVAFSISLWLIPPSQGTKIIAVGATRLT